MLCTTSFYNILGLEVCWKRYSSKTTVEEKLQSFVSSWHIMLVNTKSAFKQAILVCSKQKQNIAEELKKLAQITHELLKDKYVL